MNTQKTLFGILMYVICSPVMAVSFIAVFLYQYAWLGGYWAMVAFDAMVPKKENEKDGE